VIIFAQVVGLGAGAMLAIAALGLLRVFVGPTLYDRLAGAHGVAIMAALVCASLAVAFGDEAGLDVALALVLAGYVGAAASLKFFRFRSFQPPIAMQSAGSPRS